MCFLLSYRYILLIHTYIYIVQVSNWFINARVRLWKPMVEEMYQQEAKDHEGEGEGAAASTSHNIINSQQQQHRDDAGAAAASNQTHPQINQQPHNPQGSQRAPQTAASSGDDVLLDNPELCGSDDNHYHEYGNTELGPPAGIRLGTAGDVSLTLGLRHAGNAPEKNRPFRITDFGGR